MRLIDADALKAEWQNGFYKKIVDALMDDAPTVDAVPVEELKNRNVKFYDKGKAFEVFFPIGLDLDTVNNVEIRGRKFVPIKSIEQLKWERDTAIQQLEEHGIPFCGKAEDVVRVVRCGDCRHYDHYMGSSIGSGVCSREKRKMNPIVDCDWYCADGERREE